MKKVLQIIAWVLAAAAVVGVLVVNARRLESSSAKVSVSRSGKPVIKIGVVTPMSADMGCDMKELADVMQVRANELNKNSDNRYEYQLIFEDSRYEPKQSHLAAMKLMTVDKVDALMSVGSLSARVIMPLAKRYRIPQLSLAYDTEADGAWNFVYFLNDDDEAQLAFRAMQALGMKSYATIMIRDAGGTRIVEAFDRSCKGFGIKNKGTFYFNADDLKDYRAHLLRARELSPDIYFAGGTWTQLEVLFRQAKEMGINSPWTSVETFDGFSNMKIVAGCWLAGCKEFTPEIFGKFKELGVNARLQYSMYCYDMPKIMIDACESTQAKGNKPTGAEIAESLKRMNKVETILGTVEQTDKGFFAAKPVLLYYDDSGKGREVSLKELKKIKGIK